MENRFENLYGYVQRSLVKNIRKELGNDESMTIGILLYNAYVDSFYYEGTVKNPLLFPDEIKKAFVENRIWNLELMYYLAKYFCKAKTKSYISELMNENSMLARNNASYYAIAFETYAEFKEEWRLWLDKLDDDLFAAPYDPKDAFLNELLNRVFHFGNYLLTIIRIPAYRTNFVPGKGNFSEHIYRVVTGQILEDNSGLVDAGTGEMPPPENGIAWLSKPDSLNRYADLALVLELCFKQPIDTAAKIQYIAAITDNRSPEHRIFWLGAMARPLIYNGEFQGIIYVTKNFSEGNYTSEDFEKFKKAVVDFHIQSIIHTSKFDTARIFLERITDTDLQLKVHPLIKVLSIQHIFSSAAFGMVIQPEEPLYIRYRENKFMRSEKTNMSQVRLFDIFDKELNFDIGFHMQDNNHYWHDFSTNHTRSFNNILEKYFDIGEELNIKSFTCLKFPENESYIYYILFNANHTEVLRGDSDDPVKQSYALRTHSGISKLADAYLASKRLTDIQNNLLMELQLGILHEQKSFLRTKVIKQLDEMGDMGPKRQIVKKMNEIKYECDSAIDRFDDFIKVMVEQANDRVYNIVNKKAIDQIFSKLQAANKSKHYKIMVNSDFVDETHKISSYLYTIQFILEELVSNAIKQYSSPEAVNIEKKEIRLVAKPTIGNGKLIGFGFEVTNTGTKIPDSMIEYAGKERIANGANNSTGFGFYFIQNMLKRVLTNPYPDGKYFSIRNTTEGVEVKFYVIYKPVRR